MPDVDIGSLTLQISASAKGASSSIDTLAKKLGTLRDTVNGMTGLASVSSQLTQFARSMSTLSAATGTLSGFKSAANAVKSAVKAFEGLRDIDTKSSARSIKDIVKALESLQSVEKAGGFSSTVNALKKLPDVARGLGDMDMGSFATRIQEITTALAPLATEIDQISSGFSRLPQRLNQLNTAANSASAGTNRLGVAFRRVFSYVMLRRIGTFLGGLIQKSTEYVEDLNLFTVAMGKYADSAQEYAEKVSEVMGIDVAQWLRAQGVFQTLATGFGVSADRAAIMSKNLTQLAYDLSSFYNLDIDKAMQKLESGFAGEIEPVRRLGYDLSKTTLQATAADLGITKLFADMTQAEKSQLRYYALMTQVTQVQGDMARTLTAPANQLRILTAQLEMTKRALGNIFIPALNAVLPYLIAFAKFVRLVADEIARFFGYTLPEIDYSDISVGIGDVEDSVEDLSGSLGHASGRAKELKGLLASFDELNIIQSETGGGSGHGSGGLGDTGTGGWTDFELPQYDFLKNVLQSKADAIFERMKKTLDKMRPILRKIVDNFDTIKQIAIGIGIALAGWRVAQGIQRLIENWPTILRGIGISAMVGGFALEFSGMKNIGAGKANIWDYLKAAIGAALGIAGSLIVFGTGPLGWTIGISAAIVVGILSFRLGHQEALREQIEQAFFDGVGRPIEEIADAYNEHMNAITIRFDPLLETADAIHAVDESSQRAATDFAGLMQSLEEGAQITPEKVAEIQTAYDTLYEGMSEKLGLVNDLIRNSLIVAMQDATQSVGLEVNNILGELARITGNEEAHLRDLKAEADTLITSLAGMTVGSDEYNAAIQHLGDITGEMAALTQVMDPAVGQWQRLKEEMANGVNFKSVEDAKAAIESMATTTQGAKDAIDKAFQEADNYILGKIKYAEQYAPEEVKFWQEYRAVNKHAFDQQKDNIDRDFLEMSDTLQESLGEHLLNVVRDFDGTNVGAYYEAASETVANYIKPIGDALQDAYDDLGIEGKVWATDAATEVTDGLVAGYDYNFNRVFKKVDDINQLIGEEYKYLPQTMLEHFKRGLDERTPDFVQAVTDTGTSIGGGFVNGINNEIKSGTENIAKRFKRWWNNLRPVSGVAGDPFSWGTVEIQPYATGGYPRAGSLFLAGEGGGAELVGSMGNQTAVANGDQIVSGIAYGVSQANAEEARLLREILGYVRKVAQNGGNVVFSPSPEAGRAITYAVDMYATQRGY